MGRTWKWIEALFFVHFEMCIFDTTPNKPVNRIECLHLNLCTSADTKNVICELRALVLMIPHIFTLVTATRDHNY